MTKAKINLFTLILLALFTLVLGCNSAVSKVNIYQYYCSYESQALRRTFILDCIEKGNPHSDEEPEDLVSQCSKTAENVYCIYSNQFEAERHYKKRGQDLQDEVSGKELCNFKYEEVGE